MSVLRLWRKVHLWAGLLTAAPMVVLAVSGVLWLHRDSLGLHSAKIELPHSAAANKSFVAQPPFDCDDWRIHLQAIDEAIAEAKRLWQKSPKLDRIELKHQPGHGIVVKVRAAKNEQLEPHEVIYSPGHRAVVSLRAGSKWIEQLHKGDLLFGPRWSFLWLDLSAAGMLIVVITGLWIWWVRPRAKPGASNSLPLAGGSVAPSAAGENA